MPPKSPPGVRIAPAGVALALLAGAAVAAAPVAADPANTADPAATNPIKLSAFSYLRAGKKIVTVPRAKVVLRGSLAGFVPGEKVLIKAHRRGVRDKRKLKSVSGKAGETAKFELGFKFRKRGRWKLTAQRIGVDGKATGPVAKQRLHVVMAHASGGSRGLGVRALQHRLKELGYLVNSSGHFNGTTGRAVHAFRKVNRMSRTSVANRSVFRKLAKGGGAFKLRYPKAGKHVEFDWSRQIVVLARGDKPVMTIHTSSGSPVTPTAFGKFHFWLKQAGYNQKQMYFSTYFHNGQAIHGFSSVPDQPASHGCLRIPIANAIRVYNWIDIGDTIYSYR